MLCSVAAVLHMTHTIQCIPAATHRMRFSYFRNMRFRCDKLSSLRPPVAPASSADCDTEGWTALSSAAAEVAVNAAAAVAAPAAAAHQGAPLNPAELLTADSVLLFLPVQHEDAAPTTATCVSKAGRLHPTCCNEAREAPVLLATWQSSAARMSWCGACRYRPA